MAVSSSDRTRSLFLTLTVIFVVIIIGAVAYAVLKLRAPKEQAPVQQAALKQYTPEEKMSVVQALAASSTGASIPIDQKTQVLKNLSASSGSGASSTEPAKNPPSDQTKMQVLQSLNAH